MPMTLVMLVLIVVVIVIVAFAALNIGKNQGIKEYEQKVGSAETRARSIIDDAVKTAETKKREALPNNVSLNGRDDWIRTNDLLLPKQAF